VPRGLVAFLAVCALIAGGTLLAREIRLEREKSARYARIVAACANGRGFTFPDTAVLCYAVHLAR